MRRELIVPLAGVLLGLGAMAYYVVTAEPPEPLPIVGRPASAIQRPIMEDTGQGWRVTKMTSAHRMMVVNVETARTGEAVAIAQQIVTPVRDRYDEILVLFFEPHANPPLATLRVQWTAKGGYRTLALR